LLCPLTNGQVQTSASATETSTPRRKSGSLMFPAEIKNGEPQLTVKVEAMHTPERTAATRTNSTRKIGVGCSHQHLSLPIHCKSKTDTGVNNMKKSRIKI